MSVLDNRALIIFDKDGTLIDFNLMWGGWIEALADRLETATGQPVAQCLYEMLGYDAAARLTLPGSHLAVTPMARLWQLTRDVVQSLGHTAQAAEAVVVTAWQAPDPVVLAQPITDLTRLFESLRARGLKIAVATTDDREPTIATLAALGVLGLVDGIYCADDGMQVKPAPDAVLAACRDAGIAPGQAAMVGDSVADLVMARAAGAFAIGVASGVSPASVLQPHADLVLSSVAELV